MHLKSIRLHPEKYPTREYYPFNQPLFQQQDRLEFTAALTFFVGENGTGKSTLMKAICQKSGIPIWQDESMARFRPNPYEQQLRNYLSLEWTNGRVPGSYFGSDIFQYFARALDEWAATDAGQLRYFGGESLLTKSHGQSLMAYFRARYKIEGLYLLDEPETALSPKSQLELLDLLVRMSAGGQAQFIVASHSPILLGCPGGVIYSFDTIPLSQVEYEQTEHYRIYRDFLLDRRPYVEAA